MKTTLSFLFSLAATVSLNAQAAIVSGYGVAAGTGTASYCPSYCSTEFNGDFKNDFNGGEYQTSATSTENSYGSATASASYTGSSPSYLPTLKVKTSSNLGKSASAGAFGSQGYTYNGADTTITLDFNLHGSVGNNPAGYVSNQLTADVAVVVGSALPWSSGYSTLIYEIVPEVGYPLVGNEFLFITGNGLNQNKTGSISFDVTDGMDFYVIASLSAISKNGFSDASNTFTLNFFDDTGLTAASVSTVPVPAAVWLFGSGLVALLGLSRRNKSL